MQNLLDWGRGEELNLFPLNQQKEGLDRDLNPGPRAPEARIIPLDQRAGTYTEVLRIWIFKNFILVKSQSLSQENMCPSSH